MISAIREVSVRPNVMAIINNLQLVATRAKQKTNTSRPFVFKVADMQSFLLSMIDAWTWRQVSPQGIQLIPDIDKKHKVCLPAFLCLKCTHKPLQRKSMEEVRVYKKTSHHFMIVRNSGKHGADPVPTAPHLLQRL